MENSQQPPEKKTSPARARREPVTMGWGRACEEVAAGHRVTRTAWAADGRDAECIFLHAGLLHLRKQDGTLHRLLVGSGDLEATDWSVVEVALPFTMPPVPAVTH